MIENQNRTSVEYRLPQFSTGKLRPKVVKTDTVQGEATFTGHPSYELPVQVGFKLTQLIKNVN